MTADETDLQWIEKTSLQARNSERDEKWLQSLLYKNPDLMPISKICPGQAEFIPVCRELTIPKAGASVFLDIFGVTPDGKLVLIECKLWRNPQARREVIAQILEYASLLRQWSYGDLTARLMSQLKVKCQNPLYEAVRGSEGVLSEADFVDQVSASLKMGDFILIIAGDGIRSDVQAIAEHLNEGGSAAKLALVEFQLWEDQFGNVTVIPAVPMRTEVLKQRVIVSDDGTPISLATENESDNAEAMFDLDRTAQTKAERAFWQGFIDAVSFDHPEQPKPRHGGRGWVRMALPAPANWIVAYRMKKGEAGMFITLSDDAGKSLFEDLQTSSGELGSEIGEQLDFDIVDAEPFKATMSINYNGAFEADALHLWLLETANKATSSIRTFLAQYE